MEMKSTRGRGRGRGGEIVQVQGGHILRSTGRKDRHSKVYTAKGPRDRRVRLAAHTAIQFYDVQDRLGYDRPSKAVDWLINKAQNAIDKLSELPPWHPNADPSSLGLPFHLSQINENPSTSSQFPSMDFHNFPIQNPNSSHNQAPISGSCPAGFEVNIPRTAGWSGGGDGESRVGFLFNPSQPIQQPPLMLCQSSAYYQREPLQSSYSNAWDNDDHNVTNVVHHSEGFLGFQVPAPFPFPNSHN